MERRLSAIVRGDVAGYRGDARRRGRNPRARSRRTRRGLSGDSQSRRRSRRTPRRFPARSLRASWRIEFAVGVQGLMAERNSDAATGYAIPSRRPHGRCDGRRGRGVRRRREHRRPPRSDCRPRRRGRSAKACHEASKHLSPPFLDAGVTVSKNIAEPVYVWTWEPAQVRAPVAGRPRTRRTCRLSTEPRSWACCRLPISATAPTNIFPTD